jgi:predicted DNA-binding transcriptional regulator AlpA
MLVVRTESIGDDVSEPTTFCNGTYHRHATGIWTYAWQEPVPGARDLTLREALAQRLVDPGSGGADQPTQEEWVWAVGLGPISRPVVIETPGGGRDVVVGMDAPELNVLYMLTVAEVADLAAVSKATIDSYRYRGYLPEPQVVKGRTPLWSRPVIRHWLRNRPGSGWRTDVYGTREHTEPERRLPISGTPGAR